MIGRLLGCSLDAVLHLGDVPSHSAPLAICGGQCMQHAASESLDSLKSGGEGGVGGVEAGEVLLDRRHDPPLLVQRRQRHRDSRDLLAVR